MEPNKSQLYINTNPQATPQGDNSPSQAQSSGSTPPTQNKHPFGLRPPFLLMGFVIVLSASYLLYTFLSSSRSVPIEQVTQRINVPAPLFLTLESPSDETLVENNTLVVKGKTLPNTTVVFYTEENDGSAESNASGEFEGTIPLVSGINTLTVAAFGENGEEESMTVDVVYDQET